MDTKTGLNKIIHKRSSAVVDNKAKLPTKDQLEFGELAINFAKGYETISFKNNSDEIVEIIPSARITEIINQNAETVASELEAINQVIEDNEEIVATALTDLDSRVKVFEETEIATKEDLSNYTPIENFNLYTESTDNTLQNLEDTLDCIPLIKVDDDSYAISAAGTRTSEDITISGGPLESFAKQVYSDGVLPAGTDLQDFFKKLLCTDTWPSVTSTTGSCTLSISAPSIKKTPTNSIVTLGTPITFSAITANEVSVTATNPEVTGFKYGYADGVNGSVVNSSSITTTTTYNQKSGHTYKLVASSTGFTGTLPLSASSTSATSCVLQSTTLTANLDNNTYKVTLTGPTYEYSYDGIKSYVIVSNLGTKDSAHTSTEVVAVTAKATNTPSTSATVTVTGVYPVFDNIINGAFTTDATHQRDLQTGVTFQFLSVPKETPTTPFMFDFPSTKTISSFKIKDPSGNWVPYSSDYTTDTTVTKTINGKSYTYNRLKTNGLQGAGSDYQITLSSALNK